jgi:hypothetical protein
MMTDTDKKISALFVETNGIYFNDPIIDPWDIIRNAMNYAGPLPVIAHPPCKRWGRYWSGGPSAKTRRNLGDDSNAFAHSLWCVRTFGGVIEHPEASHAWKWFGLNRPVLGEWKMADEFYGWTTCVAQGNYGHKARKLTWLYVVSPEEPMDLDWSIPKKDRLDEGFHSKQERIQARANGQKPVKRLSAKENLATPKEFKELLISLVKETPY